MRQPYMKAVLKALVPAAFIAATTSSFAEPVAQLNISWSFGSAVSSQNNWQANALLGQRYNNHSAQLPIYQYSIGSDGYGTSQLLAAPAAKGLNPLNVDGGISFSTAMMMAGFVAAGLIIAEELSDDETPPVEPQPAS